VFRVSKEKTQRLTFDGTAGGLRSDHVYAIFTDREGVIWFGTDRGVCRFDPHAPRVESVGEGGESNFVRALYQTSNGRTLAGTNRGLFVYDEKTRTWNIVPGLGQNIIYAVAEDRSQRLLVASVSGFYVSPRQSSAIEEQMFARLESGAVSPDGVGSVRAIAQFNGSTYYAIFGRGVERIDGGRASLSWSDSAPNTRDVVSLLADGDNRLLIGTARDGVLVSDGKTIRDEPAFGILKGPAVRSMARTPDGSLWFGHHPVFICVARRVSARSQCRTSTRVFCSLLSRAKPTRSGAARAATASCAFFWIRLLDQLFQNWIPSRACRRRACSPRCHNVTQMEVTCY
jgi:ligand-binding sensor domain-containing protein